MSDWTNQFNDSMSESDIAVALNSVPSDIAYFLKSEVEPLIATKKIQAIKALRMESGFGLRTAKRIVDTMQSGVQPSTNRFADSTLIDSIEAVEAYLKRAIRDASGDDKTATVLLAMKQQLQDLWEELVELPPKPKKVGWA